MTPDGPTEAVARSVCSFTSSASRVLCNTSRPATTSSAAMGIASADASLRRMGMRRATDRSLDYPTGRGSAASAGPRAGGVVGGGGGGGGQAGHGPDVVGQADGPAEGGGVVGQEHDGPLPGGAGDLVEELVPQVPDLAEGIVEHDGNLAAGHQVPDCLPEVFVDHIVHGDHGEVVVQLGLGLVDVTAGALEIAG